MDSSNFSFTSKQARLHPIQARFLAVNEARLRRTRQMLQRRQQDFIDIVALLFHINHPLLPGYVSKNTPAGICDFGPGKTTLSTIKRLFKTFEFKHKAPPKLPIQGLYLMGSPGSIAYSRNSDLDIWLCHTQGLAPDAIQELQKKAKLIESWADKRELEVHFFVFDAPSFKSGETTPLDSESSGSSQHSILLDEFYRSSLFIAGLTPIWWQIPPDEEIGYEDYLADRAQRRQIRPNEHIDFGGLDNIPAEEFLGAAIWQICKSLESPYKSIMKLLLIEIYANEYPHNELLSLGYKHQIYQGTHDLAQLDPYLTLYYKLEKYLLSHKDQQRIELVRRAFYLKINEPLSKTRTETDNWRRELLNKLVTDWQWSAETIALLDARGSWKIDTIIAERGKLVPAITYSYQQLSSFARRHAEMQRITKRDLNLLGRKLAAALARKAGKIEQVNLGIAPTPMESEVYFHRTPKDPGAIWSLYRGAAAPNEAINVPPLKRTTSLIECISWCHFNGVLGQTTQIGLYRSYVGINVADLRAIIRAFRKLFPHGRIKSADFESLAQRPRLQRAALFINVDPEPTKDPANTAGDNVRTSMLDNALIFGSLHENLVKSSDLVITTSWDEVFHYRHEDVAGLLEGLCTYLNYGLSLTATETLPMPKVHCFSMAQGSAIARRIEQIYSYISEHFQPYDATTPGSYLVESESQYHIIYRNGEHIEQLTVDSLATLYQELCSPQRHPVVPGIDPESLRNTRLPSIYAHHEDGVIQCFFEHQNKAIEIHVLDRHGALFHQQVRQGNIPMLADHFHKFLQAVSRRRQDASSEDDGMQETAMEFYILLAAPGAGQHGSHRIARIDPEELDCKPYLDLQVIMDLDDEDHALFTIYLGDQEFSTVEHGGKLFDTVASQILNLRQSREPYPIYITDIDLSPALIAKRHQDRLEIAHFLIYKKRLEEQLNSMLNS